MMRVVAVGDFVTWGIATAGYRVVRVAEQGVFVDGEYRNQGIFFVPWAGADGKAVRHLCGDRVDYLGSFATRAS